MREKESQSRNLPGESVHALIIVQRLALLVVLTLVAASPSHASNQPGTVGLGVAQLYSEEQPNHRGPLIVVQVEPGLPAAELGGVKPGEIIVAINGVPVAGRELAEIIRKDIRGPAGGGVWFTILRPAIGQVQVALIRVPYPPHKNPDSDAFSYSIPGHWTVDPRYSFPLPWAPALAHHGVEDLAFTPNFADTSSPEYHSYLFFWWIEGTSAVTAQQLETEMVAYFRGLAEERGKQSNFTPNPVQVTASYAPDASSPRSLGGAPAKSFSGTVRIYDTKGKVIALNSEVVTATCPGSGHSAFFFAMSQLPRDQPIWTELDAVRDSFKCGR